MNQSSVESTTKIHKISLLFLWKNIHFKIFKQKHKDKRTKDTILICFTKTYILLKVTKTKQVFRRHIQKVTSHRNL